MYCRGSGQSDKSDRCTIANGYKPPKGKPDLKDAFIVTFPGTEEDHYIGRESLKGYLGIPKIAQNIIIIDGRLDLPTGTEDEYLDYINALPEDEAIYFAN